MRQHLTTLTTGALAALAVGAILLPTAAAQDSVSKAQGVAGSDAVMPFTAAEATNNYVVDLTPFTTSWGTEFGIAPIMKLSQPDTLSFFTSLPSAQAISNTTTAGTFSGATYGVWNGQGFGVNDDTNLNDAPGTLTPSGPAQKLAVATAEFSNSFNGILTGLVEYDPTNPGRLYVQRVASAVNGTFLGEDCAQFGLGAVDAAGNTTFRADDFQIGPCSGGQEIVGNNIFRVDAAARTAGTLNRISVLGGSDAAATDWVLVNSGTTHNAPSSIPSDIAGRPVYIGSNFNSQYVFESAPLVTSTTSAHLGVAPDQRGGVNFSKVAFLGANAVGTASLYGKDNAIDFETRRILLWGMDANGAVTGTRSDLLIDDDDTITDNSDGHVFGDDVTYPSSTDIAEFVHHRGSTPFRGGNGQVAVGRDQAGMVLAATPAALELTGNTDEPVNAIVVAKINPNMPATPPVWTTAGYTGSPTDGVLGKAILDGPGGTVIGRMTTLDQVTGGNPNGPSVSAPMIDSVGNVWFLSAVEIFGGMASDFDLALLRAVYNVTNFSYELELVMEVGDEFAGLNSSTDYQLRFLRVAGGAPPSAVNPSTAFSGNIMQCALNDAPSGALDTAAPQTLGGLVLAAEIVYDVNGDGDYVKVTGAGGDPTSEDQEYQVLLYVGALDPTGPMEFCNATDNALASCPCAPGDPTTGCDTPIPPMQGGGLTGGIRLDLVAQSITPNNRATVLGTGFPTGSSPGVVVIRAPSLDSGSPIVFGDGLRCISVPLVRLSSAVATSGSATITFGHGPMAPTGTNYYQMWFRSTPASYCDPTAAFNLSNGQTLDW